MSERHTVAVYGTLREGGSNHTLLKGASSLGAYTLSGGYCMVDMGFFPGLIECDTKQEVVVEVYEVSTCMLRDMDWLEGHDPEGTIVGNFYTRKEVEIEEGLKAWMYVLPGEYMNRAVIESGDFIEFMGGVA